MSTKIKLEYDILYDAYVIQSLSLQKTADFLNVSIDVVMREMKYHNIKSRSKTDRPHAVDIDIDEFINDYCILEISKADLAKKYNRSPNTIHQYIKDNAIDRRSHHDRHKKNFNKQELIDYISKNEMLTMDEIALNFNTNKTTLLSYMREFDITKTRSIPTMPTIFRSRGEIEIQEFIESLGISTTHTDRRLLQGTELDILIPSHNIAIEYNGLYWHSTAQKADSNYHLNKTMKAYDNGIRLIHIFENEWLNKPDIVKAKLRSILNIKTTSVYARKCVVKTITTAERKDFLNINHIQGDGAGSINYGLYHEGSLVAVINFLNIGTDKYKLNRFATSCSVTGGFSKLLSYFIKHHNPEYIETFADLRFSSMKSNVYETCGFTMQYHSKPNYVYTKNFTTTHSRQQFMKHKLSKKLAVYDKNLTEEQNMLNNGYYRIYDCGNMKFIWRKP